MVRTTTLAAAGSLVALLSLAGAAHAATNATVVIQAGTPHYSAPPAYAVQYHAPPPPRYERVPPPRRGMVWSQGHWEWRGHRHVWMAGYWVKARPGYHNREPRWVEHDGRWAMQRGGWDRDRDGVANRYDRDRDGDGVPNRRDRQPDNPRRN